MEFAILGHPSQVPNCGRQVSSAESDYNQHGIQLKKLSGGEWDSLIATFADTLHEQSECFNEQRWSPEQIERLVVYKGMKALGGALVRKIKVPFLNKTIAIIRWGPLWRRHDSPISLEAARIVYKSIVTELSEKQQCFVLLIPRADPEYTVYESKILGDLGFKRGFQPKSPDRYFVDVTQNPDELRANLAQKWRYNLKKAEMNGLESSFETGPEALEIFLELYSSMVERKQYLETSPIETLPDLMKAEELPLRPDILIVRKDGVPVAGAVLDCSGETAIYLYGATNKKALGLKAGYLMQWSILQYLSSIPRIKWYALGGGTSENCSLHQFKRGLSGKNGVITPVPSYHYLADSASTELVGRALVSLQILKVHIQVAVYNIVSKLRRG